MSLYDLYFSDKNKQHMFSLLNQITREQIDKSTFDYILNDTFEQTNVDNLLDINKEFVEKVCSRYNIYSIDDNLEDKPKVVIKEDRDNKPPDATSHVAETGYISSINKLSGNRFTYKIKTEKSIKTIKKLVIPIEDNDIFVNNTLKLIIPELGVETIAYCIGTSVIKKRTYGNYIPENMNIHKQSENITVIIMSLMGNETYEDAIKIKHEDESYIVDNKENVEIGDILRSNKNNNYKIIDINEDKVIFNKKILEDEIEFVNINLQNIIVYEY